MKEHDHVDSPTVNVLSLAAGYGGLDLGLRLALPSSRLVCAVEIEAYAAGILAARMEEGRLDDAPVWTDLRTFDGKPWRGVVDLVAAGYPCQPFSVAGKQLGADDPRHLWPHVARVVREIEPSIVFIENVANHLNLGFEQVRDELRDMGYRVEAGLFAAVEVGAPHRRARLFALAYSDGYRRKSLRRSRVLDGERSARGGDADGRGGAGAASLEHATRGYVQAPPVVLRPGGSGEVEHRRGCGDMAPLPWPPLRDDEAGWAAYLQKHPGLEPAIRPELDGSSSRVERLRLLGNGVVPQQAARAFRELHRSMMLPSWEEILS